ncbi:MAG: hypothetical protein R3B09_14075 [Nannocystaceae bacterium]
MAEENSADVREESIPPPPPWAGERALERMVSAALRAPRAQVARAVADEIVIDLDDLDVDPRLLDLLRRHFHEDQVAIDRALSRYCGRYRSLSEYAVQVLEGEELPDWLWPYIDVDAIARDWAESGDLWVLDDADDARSGVHVFNA